ncbi:thioredoxin domain-containing protein [Kitasatospora sp. NPDC096147]|uniref:thioredoxin domain-containing protein n=1 Tax=Kitasatospora sp. NPDC096147 TaxID=3364093 RepID=UPI00380E64C0
MSTPKNTAPTTARRPDARTRLAEAREAEARRTATRRRLTTAAAVVAVLALSGVTVAVVDSARTSAEPAQAGTAAALVVPAHATGPDGTVVTYGRADAPHILKVYEDFRCPVCEQLETSAGRTIQQLADEGTYKIEFHLAAFLDDRLGGKGSKTALAAVGAALNEGPDKFKAFHDVLYAHQPEERTDGFGDVNTILDLAGKVPGLKTDAFVKAVTEGTYLPWAAKVAKAFQTSGVRGTPTVLLDDKQLNVFPGDRIITGDAFAALVRQSVGTP